MHACMSYVLDVQSSWAKKRFSCRGHPEAEVSTNKPRESLASADIQTRVCSATQLIQHGTVYAGM